MEFPKALDRSGLAPCEGSGQSRGTLGCKFSDNEGSIDPDLEPEETTLLRAVAARLHYFAPDITFATMEVCSKMSRRDMQTGRALVGSS